MSNLELNDPTLQNILSLPDEEKTKAMIWSAKDGYPNIILPDILHNSFYANPLSKCRGKLQMRAFCASDRGTRFALCLSCEEKVEVSISQFLLARGLI